MGELIPNIDGTFHELCYSFKSVGFVGVFCEVIYSKIQRTSLSPWKWLTHFTDRGYVKVHQSHYKPEVPRVFQEDKFPRFRNNDTGWW
jgi:hypothetical protein